MGWYKELRILAIQYYHHFAFKYKYSLESNEEYH